MRKLTIGIAVLLLTSGAIAQNNRASIGAEFALPVGDLGLTSGFGFGGSLGYELPVGKYFDLVAQAGYINFLGKELTISTTILGTVVSSSTKTDPTGLIPVQVGFKYYFMDPQEGFYAGILTGAHMFIFDEPQFDLLGDPDGTKSKLKANFSLASNIGYVLARNLDIAVRYQMMFAKQDVVTFDPVTFAVTTKTQSVTNGYMGLRIAYMFGRP